mmetsp:Transcript_29696/g.71489  ORF Transcript_29696/g.71489 Transcript_29696/m.71489 type:complete len:555 (+) Transcript_29696:159-1823(+)|eukprot:CAMPEP_0113605698 /NCGR_PEP_ID=MMETSP0017_2-20120614/2465_1 /TAXON_ID=2856 /ORGANISM="Cylindrotheca closterium" /LENGTH=554 /DNA_ID=CAMNT_0000514203 /DNA_START=62 /DNA_END=1726 /DNA_ORIENTATION=+ /assembly_acc=CAM_ASM_000147
MSSDWKPTVGCRVQIEGLQGRADLNGRSGEVIKPVNKETGRIAVKVLPNLHPLQKSEKVLIKPVNVVESPPNFLDGFEIVHSGDVTLGRIAVATKDYQPGDLVLVEPPTFVVDEQSGYPGMFDTFLRCSPEDQAAILDMYCPPIEDEKDHMTLERLRILEIQWTQYASQYGNVKILLPLDKAKRLMRIMDTNAHGYSTESTGGLVATPSTIHTDRMIALFARGSKVQHSCAPNVTNTTDKGKLEYMATRPIKKGDRISFSYQSSVCEIPRAERKEFLEASKSFTCQCERCLGPDECNPVWCTNCDNARAVAFSIGIEKVTRCIQCESILKVSDIEQGQYVEEECDNKLNQSFQSLQDGSFARTGGRAIGIAIDTVNEAANKLHPLHAIHAKGYALLASLGASFARLYMKQGGMRSSRAEVQNALCVSTIAILYQARWAQRNCQLIHGDLSSLKDTALEALPQKIPLFPSIRDIQNAVANLDTSNQVPEMAGYILHAGQDWLLISGQAKEVAKLFKTFLPLFHQWGAIGDENRERVAVLVESEGAKNLFPNHLVF